MKRELFVFAGQSNMMGACVYPPQHSPKINYSFEYKHKPRRLGAARGEFVPGGYPAGEFSYKDLSLAYADGAVDKKGNSTLTDYRRNTYFCPAMSSLLSEKEKTEHPFTAFSEATASIGPTLAPLVVEELEQMGVASAYAHVAKGSVRIAHFFTDAMALEYSARVAAYNQEHGTCYSAQTFLQRRMAGAGEYFFEKCRDFLADAKVRFFADELSEPSFLWLQGEGNGGDSTVEYEIALEVLWQALKNIGFTRFFCIRIGFWGKPEVARIMQAQERFTKAHDDAFMLTRVGSYLPFQGHDDRDWFVQPPSAEYQNCRDSFFGFKNQHINEKGFLLIARHAAKNLYRVLIEGKEPLLEPENVRLLKQGEEAI